jgi:hypothetical protein
VPKSLANALGSAAATDAATLLASAPDVGNDADLGDDVPINLAFPVTAGAEVTRRSDHFTLTTRVFFFRSTFVSYSISLFNLWSISV